MLVLNHLWGIGNVPSDHVKISTGIGYYLLYVRSPARITGFWKFNNDLLHDKDYVHLIKKTRSDCKRNLHQYTDKGLVWELTMLKIRSASIPYCIKKKKQLTAFKDILEKERNLLQENLDSNPSDFNLDRFNTAKNELEQVENMKHMDSCLDPKPNGLKMVKNVFLI